jgi:hypothetical protein
MEKFRFYTTRKIIKCSITWFKTNFEDAAKEKLTKGGISENITSDPSVQKYMIDRKIQFGYAMYDSAINYAKNAKTPNEFMNLVSEHDLKNLRQIFSKTPDEEFEKLRSGLIKRIENRKKEALNLGSSSSLQTPIETTLKTPTPITTSKSSTPTTPQESSTSTVKPKILSNVPSDVVGTSSGGILINEATKQPVRTGLESIESVVSNKGEKINASSQQNKELKKEIFESNSSPVTIINNTAQQKANSPSSSSTPPEFNESDDEAIYYIKQKKGKL